MLYVLKLWDIHKKRLHMISWKDTCKPKICGGLGIPSIDTLYHAFGCTIVWRFYNSKSYLFWWWKEKYGYFWNYNISKGSIYWKSLCDVAKCLLHSLNFKIITCSSISFFWDLWCFVQSVAEGLKNEHFDTLINPPKLTDSSLISNGT